MKRNEKQGKLVKKFASAHDLRRTFGLHWSRKLMPAELQELMRHKDISVTMKYYVGQNAEATADELWAGFGGNLGQIWDMAEERKQGDSKTPIF